MKVEDERREAHQIHQGGMSPLASRKPPSSRRTRNRKAPPVEATFSLRHRLPLKRKRLMPMLCSIASSRMSVKNLHQTPALSALTALPRLYTETRLQDCRSQQKRQPQRTGILAIKANEKSGTVLSC